MPRPRRRSGSAARPSSANGGSSTALSPTAWKRLENACSPSLACRRANGAVYAPQMQSNVCTKNLSDGSRPKLFCHPPTPPRCCSGRCPLQDRSTCARWMVGRRSPQNPLISRLTLPPETIPSCYRRLRTPNSNRIPDGTKALKDRERPIEVLGVPLSAFSEKEVDGHVGKTYPL